MKLKLTVAVVLVLVGTPLLSGDIAPSDPVGPPNVLIIMTDDHRLADTMEFMPKTMKWFGLEGTAFTEAYAAGAVCCPARAGLWTGQYVHNNGVPTTAQGHLVDEDAAIQRYLHDAGYTTAAFGKFFNSYPLARNPKHFDDWAFHNSGYATPFNDHGVRINVPYSPHFVRDRSLGFLASTEASDAKPWYLLMTPYAPHNPWIAEEKYANVQFPPWLGNPATLEVDRTDKPQHMQSTVPLVSSAAGVPFHAGPEGVTTLGAVGTSLPVDRQVVLRTLLTVDDMVDAVMTQLEAQGELDNTFAVFMSDQGYLWGEHGWYNKLVPYTSVIKIPFFVRYPAGFEPGTASDRIVSAVDVLPTILDLADLSADPTKNIDGRSLLDGSRSREHALVEYNNQGLPLGAAVPTWATIRSHDVQYVEYYNPQGVVTFRELYDLEADPWQLENRFRATNVLDPVDPAEAEALRAALAAARTCRGATCP